MRKLAVGTAFAMLATPALAADPVVYIQDPVPPVVHEQPNKVSGHVEWFLGGLRIGIEGESQSAWVFGGDARVNYAIDRRWNIQGDLYGESIRFNEGFALDRFGAAAHAYWRDPNSFAIGAFGMYGTYPLGFGPSASEYMFGPEAQAYFGNVTVYGQAYWGQVHIPFGFGSINQWGARGVLRYFVHDNFRIDGELAYNSLFEGGDSLNTLTALAQANYRFDDTPFTVFGRYQFDRVSMSGDSANAHRLLVGLRVTMGADTLMAEDRYGATMDLPRHIRFLPFGGGPGIVAPVP